MPDKKAYRKEDKFLHDQAKRHNSSPAIERSVLNAVADGYRSAGKKYNIPKWEKTGQRKAMTKFNLRNHMDRVKDKKITVPKRRK